MLLIKSGMSCLYLDLRSDFVKIISDAIEEISGVQHGFYTRRGGVSKGKFESLNTAFMKGEDRALVLENRRRIMADLGGDANNLCILEQVHSADVVVIDGDLGGEIIKGDAMVTKEKGLALGIQTADCGPILCVDEEAGVIGAAHAGWKGAKNGVIENMMVAMEDLGAERGRIVARLGPCIARGSYQVDEDFRAGFLVDDGGNDRFFRVDTMAKERYLFDLPEFILGQMGKAGIGDIAWIGEDTYSQPKKFFSYRCVCHEGWPITGRQVSAIILG